MKSGFLLLLGAWIGSAAVSAEPAVIRLWDGAPPLGATTDQPEKELPVSSEADRDIARVTNISDPSITVYPPKAELRNGTCVLVCPGGGYSIVAWTHEGTQVAEWLNGLGVTAAVLKYRVPAAKSGPAHLRPLLDGQRALSLIRAQAADWGIATNRIGVLGFSAGGHLAAWLIAEGSRWVDSYPAGAKSASCRPDFGVLIYPAYLTGGNDSRPVPVLRAEEKPGPVFFVHAHDDRIDPENSISFFLGLKKLGVPGELHVYQGGGHGFGMLRRGRPIHDWPARCAEWMRIEKWIQ